MTARPWQDVVAEWEASKPGRMNVRLLVHLAMRMDMVDEQSITSEVLREKRQAYEDELTVQARGVGCDRQGVMDEKTLKQAHEQSTSEGKGIVNTYNYDLAHAINAIHDRFPTANRHTYAKYLTQWHEARSTWKDVQISLHNRMEWKSKAQIDFTRFNNIQGYAKLVPSSHASCDICKRWIRRGRVPLGEAIPVIEEWPPHLNCIHYWEVKPLGDMRCEDLWVGAEPAGFRIKEMIIIDEKGSSTSGNHGHGGRIGKVGGSAPKQSAFMSAADAADIALPPDDGKYEYFYHATRYDSNIDSILKEGIKPGSTNKRVFLSKDEIRDLGSGFVIVRVPKGKATEGKDVVMQGLVYREWTLQETVPPKDVIRTVRVLTDRVGHRVREDVVARYALSGNARQSEIDDLPDQYKHWFSTKVN